MLQVVDYRDLEDSIARAVETVSLKPRRIQSSWVLVASSAVLTVSLPLACNNYPMVFAPEQLPHPLQMALFTSLIPL